MLEKIVSAIQDNRWINAVKTAIIRLAYMHLGMAFIVIAYSVIGRFMNISAAVQSGMIGLYMLFCLTVGLLISGIVTHEITASKQLAYIGIFLMMIVGVPFFLKGVSLYFIFVSMVLSPLFAKVLEMFSDIKYETDKVPTAVSSYLLNLIPLIIGILLAGIITALFTYQMVWVVKGIEFIMTIMSSWIVIALTIIAICSFWVLGVHGVGVVGTLLRPFWFYMIIANGMDYVLGNPMRYISTETFFQWFVWLGGSGCTLGLAIALRYFAKSKHLNGMKKDAFFSSVYNINETLVFGTPIVDNKYFNIPFFLAPLICAAVGYVTIMMGYASVPAVAVPWVLPVPIGMFLSSLGDWRNLVLSFVLIAISFVVYLPFFLKYDADLVKQEAENA